MKLAVTKGTTSKLVQVFVMDSSQTDGRGLTGLVFNSANLSAYYYREGAASPVQISLVTMVVGTWASGGFKEIDAANMPGWYQLGLPDAALATGAGSVGVMLKGAADMAPVNAELQLVAYDPEDGDSLGLAYLDATISTVLSDINSVLNDIANLQDLSATEVNAEVVDVMRTDTVAEIAAVPAKNAPLHSMIQWLFTLVRNKRITTADLDTLRNDADGADVATAALSHTATTFTKGKYS